MKKALAFLSREGTVLGIYLLAALIIAIQHYALGEHHYNNFVIFQQSFFHLLKGVNLYAEYPSEYFDLFLYHPSFCILFVPFALLPTFFGMLFWLLFCAWLLYFSIGSLPISARAKLFFWWFVLIELVTSMHNQQTNPVITALGLLTFSSLEKGRYGRAALFPLLAFCIKAYGVVFAVLFLFYPGKVRYLGYGLLWAIVLFLLPLPITGWERFPQVYQEWYMCLLKDHDVNYGYSVMGIIHLFFPSMRPDDVGLIQVTGVLLLFATLWIQWRKSLRMDTTVSFQTLGYLLLWVILFNHAAESPTYIIAVAGVAVWALCQKSENSRVTYITLGIVLLFTQLSPTDVYPLSWRKEWFEPYLIKVVPCLVVWMIYQIQLLRGRLVAPN